MCRYYRSWEPGTWNKTAIGRSHRSRLLTVPGSCPVLSPILHCHLKAELEETGLPCEAGAALLGMVWVLSNKRHQGALILENLDTPSGSPVGIECH